jgi:hypothetical protein
MKGTVEDYDIKNNKQSASVLVANACISTIILVG